MAFFNFLAKKISYTFAVAFITVFSGWITAMVGFFLGSPFVIVPWEKLLVYFIKWLPVTLVVPTVMHYVEFGLLTPLKIPALFRSLRIINKAYSNRWDTMPAEDLIPVYRYLSDLPAYNTLAAAFNMSLTTILSIGLSYYEYKYLGVYSLTELQLIVKVMCITLIFGINLYSIATYLITEKLTNKARSSLYDIIIGKGIRTKPRALIGIRLKFFMFVWLMVVILLSMTAITYKIGFFKDYNITILVAFLLVAAMIGILFIQITTNSVVGILKDLVRVTRTIAAGGTAGYDVLSLEHEFTDIEYALMEMAWEIDDFRKNTEGKVMQRTQELQEALSELRGKDDQIQKQLDMASIIQRSILPGKIDDWNELKFAVRYMAMEKIGGDFYDVHLLKDDKIGIIIADVSGHGIPAALVTTMAKMSFGNAGAKYDSPKKIFQEVNQNILDHVKTKEYLTSFMLAIDEEYEVTYTNASHQKAIILRAATGSIELLDTNGLFIGAVEEARDTYDEKRTKLEYGDRIILYTDGIPEAINLEREEFSNARLEKAIVKYRDLHVEEFADAIINDVRQFIGSASLVDDITIMVAELVRDEAIEIVKNSKRLIRSHENEAAIAALEKGLVQYPGNQKILYNLAKAYFRVNDYKKTAKTIEQYSQNDKMNKFAYYIGGAAYYQLSDYGRSIGQFEKALSLDATFVNALFASGMAYKKMGDSQSAIKSFEKIISIDPDNKMALFEIKSLADSQ